MATFSQQPFSPRATEALSGNLGRAVMKTSAVPGRESGYRSPGGGVFKASTPLSPAFDAGLLDKDCVVVVRHQEPKANGMPESTNLCRRLVYYWTAVSKLRW
ncbi:dihydroxy-acid dehydratase [Shigella flexneri]